MSQEQCSIEVSYPAFSKSILRHMGEIRLCEKQAHTLTLFSLSLPLVGWNLGKTSFEIIGSRAFSSKGRCWNEPPMPAATSR